MEKYLVQALDANIATDEQISKLCQENFGTFTDAPFSTKLRIIRAAEDIMITPDCDTEDLLTDDEWESGFVQEISEEGLKIVLNK